MKKNIIHEIIQWAAIIAAFAFGFLMKDALPSIIPSHWNAAGQIDGYSPKMFAIWFFPTIIVGIKILFGVMKRIDPKKEKYALFEKSWKSLETIMIVFFAYIHIVSLFAALQWISDASRFIVLGMGIFFILLGNYMGKIRQNYFIGFKLPWTLADEDNWNRTHRLAGKTMVIAGMVIVISAFAVPYLRVFAFIAAMIGGFLAPCVYSYVISRKAKGN